MNHVHHIHSYLYGIVKELLVLPTVKVKWGKEVYKDIELNTDERPELFKAQIYALTGVQTQRQKVLYKGVIVNDDEWGTQKITDVSFCVSSKIHRLVTFSNLLMVYVVC